MVTNWALFAIDIKRVTRGIVKVWGISTWAPWTHSDPLLLRLHKGVYKSFIGFCFRELFSNSSWDVEVGISHWSPLDPLTWIWLEFRVQPQRQNVSRAPALLQNLSVFMIKILISIPSQNSSTGTLHPGVKILLHFQDLASHSAF